jgi:6-phosphogluconolactonase
MLYWTGLCLVLAVANIQAKFISNESKATSGKALVSGYSSEIATYTLTDGVLSRDSSWPVDPNLTWLQQVGDFFIAIHEIGDYNGVVGGVISKWQVINGQLTQTESLSLESVYPAHVLVDIEHGLAFTANYGGGSVTVVNMENASLSHVVQVLTYGEGCRDASHPHQIVRMGDWVWVIDLGCDSIYTYRVEAGQLTFMESTSVAPGYGPRHMAISGDIAIVACELESHILVFDINPDGSLSQKQELTFASVDGNVGAEVLVHNGYVYASSRGVGVVVVYVIENNQLTRVQEIALGGTWPRSIAIKDDIMLAADKNGDSVQVLTIDPNSGMLSAGGVVETPSSPAFVMFYD